MKNEEQQNVEQQIGEHEVVISDIDSVGSSITIKSEGYSDQKLVNSDVLIDSHNSQEQKSDNSSDLYKSCCSQEQSETESIVVGGEVNCDISPKFDDDSLVVVSDEKSIHSASDKEWDLCDYDLDIVLGATDIESNNKSNNGLSSVDESSKGNLEKKQLGSLITPKNKKHRRRPRRRGGKTTNNEGIKTSKASNAGNNNNESKSESPLVSHKKRRNRKPRKKKTQAQLNK